MFIGVTVSEDPALRALCGVTTPVVQPLPEHEQVLCLVALSARLRCPRLPRLGERVLTRTVEASLNNVPWAECGVEELVVAVGEVDGVQVDARTRRGHTLVRAMYLETWVFAPGHGPAVRDE